MDRVVSNLLPAWAGVAIDFDLLRIRGHGPYVETLPDNVRDVRLRCRHRDTALPAMIRFLRRERPDALLTAGHRLNRVALLARAIARVDCRIVIRMGMALSPVERDQSGGRQRRRLRSMRFWYPRADAVIAPSAGVGRDLQRHAGVPDEQLHVIPNPIVNARLDALAREAVTEPWFAEGSGVQVILGVGSLEPRKDFATLLHAFARIRQGGRPVRLAILGDGPQRSRLQGLASELGVGDDCWFPGFVINPYKYMAAAAVFALASRREGSGAVLVEALACGTPVVSTDCPSGPRETLQDGDVGPLVPVGDAAALADAIARMLDDPPAPGSLRAAAEPFDAATAARRYLTAMGLTTGGAA